ncbi:MAG: trigger factor [Kiritimatiellia bacterium]|nr:trigger factor [Kiritimatiellia bacterium]
MKVKVEKDGACRKTLVVEQPAEVVEAEYRKVLDGFARLANIPGFRKGKAPSNLVESHFTKEIWEETKDRLIAASYREAIKQAKLNPLTILDVKAEVAPKKPMVYRLILDVSPEFKLPKYKHIPITNKEINVSDDDLQKALDRLLERLATTADVNNRPARKGDWAQIDYVRKDNGRQPAPSGGKHSDKLASGRDFWLTVGEGDTLLPGFADAIAGMPVGGRKDIALQLPADFNVPELAGRPVVYDVLLKAVRERKKPVLNDEFFQSMGVQSEAGFRDKMKSTMLTEALQQEKERQKKEVIDYLLNQTVVELPESIVQEESRHMFATIARERLMRGATKEQLASQKDAILTTATKTAGEKVKLSYILHKIGEEEKVVVEEAEVEKEIQNMAQHYRLAPEELKKELEKKKEMDGIRHEIRLNKILDFLLSNAVPAEKGLMTRLFGGGKQKEATSSQAQSASGQVVA